MRGRKEAFYLNSLYGSTELVGLLSLRQHEHMNKAANANPMPHRSIPLARNLEDLTTGWQLSWSAISTLITTVQSRSDVIPGSIRWKICIHMKIFKVGNPSPS